MKKLEGRKERNDNVKETKNHKIADIRKIWQMKIRKQPPITIAKLCSKRGDFLEIAHLFDDIRKIIPGK